MMELSERLKAVVSMVTKGNTAADIGCDHGYVPIYLVENGICPKVIAMDVNKGPLEKAKQHITEYHLSDYIDTRLSDGLSALRQGEADTVIMAGMGGRLMVKLVCDGEEKVRAAKELILQPQSELAMVRSFLRKMGYVITAEAMVSEDGKFYPMMRIEVQSHGEAGYAGVEQPKDYALYDRYGGLLLKDKNPVLALFLEKEKTMYTKIKGELEQIADKTLKQEKRLEQLRAELDMIERAFVFYGKQKLKETEEAL